MHATAEGARKNQERRKLPEGAALVYALYDPRDVADGKITTYHYVGKSEKVLQMRLSEELSQYRNGWHAADVARWALGIVEEGIRPEIVALEWCPKAEAHDRETYWIARLKAEGHPLKNKKKAGPGYAKVGPIENPFHQGELDFGDQAELFA